MSSPSKPGCPNSTPANIVEKIAALRMTRKWGPARIATELVTAGVRIAASTVHRVLHRLRLSGSATWTRPAASSSARPNKPPATSGNVPAT